MQIDMDRESIHVDTRHNEITLSDGYLERETFPRKQMNESTTSLNSGSGHIDVDDKLCESAVQLENVVSLDEVQPTMDNRWVYFTTLGELPNEFSWHLIFTDASNILHMVVYFVL